MGFTAPQLGNGIVAWWACECWTYIYREGPIMTTIRRKVANSALAGIVALGCTNASGITGLMKTPPHHVCLRK